MGATCASLTMSEYTYRSQVIKALKRMRSDPQAVENSANPGCPDVECLRGWLELKYLPKWPKQHDTTVTIDHYTQQQRNFLRRRWKAGGGAWLLLRVGSRGVIENLLFDGLTAWEFVGRVPRARLTDLAILHSYGRIATSDLDEMLTR